MKPRERVQAALYHQPVDRTPRFEIWIDALLDELSRFGKDAIDQGEAIDLPSIHVQLGQDSMMMPSRSPAPSNAWKTGVDEWGRVWRNGMYVSGALETPADLKKYATSTQYARQFFDEPYIRHTCSHYPDHLLMYGSHLGPFMGAYMAMGFERFFKCLYDDPALVHAVIEDRTEWAISMFREAMRLGAEVLILGEDAAYKKGPMISKKMWQDFVYPYHRRIVQSVNRPIIFHSDGNILPMLPQIIDAGFIGYHSLEPAAGIDLAAVKRDFGKDLVLVGNVDVRVLAGCDLQAVRDEVVRCIGQGEGPGGGYMMATCNSIFNGLYPASVAEMFRYEQVCEGVDQTC